MNVSEAHTSVPTTRAPLATFDTVDFGEDRNSLRTLQGDSFELKSEVESTNSEASIPFDYSAFPEDLNDPFSQDVKTVNKQEDVWSEISINTTSSPKPTKISKRNSFDYQNLKEKKSSDSSSSNDSDSSDSDCGYIKSGYVAVSSDKFSDCPFPCDNFDSPLPQRAFLRTIGDNNSSCESTPFSSPNLSRASLPSLIQELETVKEKSKRKALEKKILRLQVTNKPVERPRSTTPINVVNFEEYKPENSPSSNSDKLSIKLPPEEFRKRHKSPLKLHGDIFNFMNEDQLFSRTKSLVVETSCQPGQSPKRVLIPPTLTPSCSPCVSPRRDKPRLITEKCPKDSDVLFSTSPDKWVAFPNVSNQCSINQNKSICTTTSTTFTERSYVKCDNLTTHSEDLLTISIVEGDNSKMCDISLEASSTVDNEHLRQEINNPNSSRVDNLHTERKLSLKESGTSDFQKEIISIVNEIFDGPQVFQEKKQEDGDMMNSNSVCAKDNNTQTTHLLLS